jgi:hypothetical protein
VRRTFIALSTAGALGLTVLAAGGQPASAASVPTYGMSFSASVPADLQRDQGEPEISTDPGGNIYTCGPSGFSNIADYAQVSLDGGDQFHLLGQAPRGQISGGEGGGDCGLASAPVKNSSGQYTWAYTGLGPLTNFSTGTAADTGRTLHASPVSESVPGVDRQWMVFTDANTVFLNYNQLAQGYTVQKSTDGGYTYGVGTVVTTAGGRIGPMRAILNGTVAESKVYFPYDDGNKVKLAFSPDNGETWGNCTVGDAGISPTAGFVVADHDKAGNIYVTYAEKGGRERQDSYVFVVKNANLSKCVDGADNVVIGEENKIRINLGNVETTVMPWIVASGAPGRFAVSFYGTDQVGDPNEGTFKGAWNVYVSMTLNGLDANPDVAQVKASSHPTHYDSICLNGTLCDVVMGDRTLVDYFAMDLNPVDGRLSIVYNDAAKKPGEAEGHVGLSVVTTQATGPSLLGGTLEEKRPRVRAQSSDPAGDALAPYGNLCVAPPSVPCPEPDTTNQPAMDFVDRPDAPAVTVQPEIDLASGEPVQDGGITVTLQLADLAGTLKQDAATAGSGSSLIYLLRWNNGYQPAGATARWSPVTGWSFAFDAYTTGSTTAGQADPTSEKIVIYPGATQIEGDVQEDGRGVIRMSIPRNLLKGLGPVDDSNRPSEIPATIGTMLTDMVAYSLVNIAPDAAVQSYLYPVDNAPAMDYRLGSAGVAPPTVVPPTVSNPGTGAGAGTGGLAATGGLGAPLLALVVVVGALALAKRRRAQV